MSGFEMCLLFLLFVAVVILGLVYLHHRHPNSVLSKIEDEVLDGS